MEFIFKDFIQSGKVAFGETQMLVFTAEILAVLWALWWVEDKPDNSVICSDSTTALPTTRET